jgi:hypothetical protein
MAVLDIKGNYRLEREFSRGGGSNLDLRFWKRRRMARKQYQKSKKMGSEIFILKTPEVHIPTSIVPIASKIIAINFYAQFRSKKNLLSFF